MHAPVLVKPVDVRTLGSAVDSASCFITPLRQRCGRGVTRRALRSHHRALPRAAAAAAQSKPREQASGAPVVGRCRRGASPRHRESRRYWRRICSNAGTRRLAEVQRERVATRLGWRGGEANASGLDGDAAGGLRGGEWVYAQQAGGCCTRHGGARPRGAQAHATPHAGKNTDRGCRACRRNCDCAWQA